MKNIKFLFKNAWKMKKSLIFIIAAKSIFDAVIPLVNIAGLGLVVNALTTGAAYSKIIKIIIIYLSINLGIKIISEILTLIKNIIERKVTNIMQYNYMQDCVNIDYHYVSDKTILNLKKKSMNVNPGLFLSDAGKFLNYIVSFIGIIYIFSVLSPWFILVLLITSTCSIILTFKTRKYDYKYQNDKVEDDRKLDYLYKVMSEYKYAKDVRINNAGSYVINKYGNILNKQLKKLKTYFKKSMKISILSTVITIIQTCAMYFYFSYQVFSNQITIAEYTVLLGATTLLTSILLGFFDNIALIIRTCKYVKLYREYIDLIKTKCTINESNKLKTCHIDFSNAEIKFKHVSFTYPNTKKEILSDINITIKRGEKIGIVGLNGSGKTTLIKLLTRIYDPTEGCITINGVDIKKIPYKQYISHIGIVLQDFLLFAYSIKENIVFDKEYDKNRLMDSLNKSGLEDKINGLENGVDTIIYKELDDNGIEFSGGEGQKLALARAIYKNAEILVLDEPTSTLDPISEYEMFSNLADISKNKTTFFISHRLSSTQFCDRILVLSNGKIVENGNHIELISQDGVYKELFTAQAKYYDEKGVAM